MSLFSGKFPESHRLYTDDIYLFAEMTERILFARVNTEKKS